MIEPNAIEFRIDNLLGVNFCILNKNNCTGFGIDWLLEVEEKEEDEDVVKVLVEIEFDSSPTVEVIVVWLLVVILSPLSIVVVLSS